MVDVDDRWVQDHTDLVLSELLIDVLLKELAEEAEALNCGQPELKIFRRGTLAHHLQELVPVAIGHLNGRNDAEANARALERISILARQHLQ